MSPLSMPDARLTETDPSVRSVVAPMAASRLADVPPSGTMAVGRRVRDLRAAGIDVVHLGAGSPDPSPACLKRPLALGSDMNITGDPAGDAQLRAAIADKLSGDQGLTYDPDTQIVVTVGAKQALYTTLLALIEPGDEVAILDPAWVTYGPAVQIAGGVSKTFTLDRKNGFSLDSAALEAVIGPRTRVIVMNTPHNPTGRVFTADELESIAAIARAHGLWVISDESFDKFVFDGYRHIGMASLDGMADRTVVLQSFSKAYGFIGGRVGYMAGPAAIASQVARFNEQVLTCVSPFMQSVALAALAEEPSWTANLRRQYQLKRDFAVDAVRRLKGFDCAVPEGTFYVFADITSFGQCADDVTMRILDETRVAVTPGTAFGPSGEGYVRFNLAGSMDIIRDGFDRLEKVYG